MLRSPTFVRACAGILCIALLLSRMGGAHLHLCLDGSEPPASVHLNDDDVHPRDAGASDTHHDIDVSLTSVAMGKDSKIELPALLLAMLVAFIVPVVGGTTVPHRRTQFLIPKPIFRFQPPLRAPPF